jgi:hypothetical protein
MTSTATPPAVRSHCVPSVRAAGSCGVLAAVLILVGPSFPGEAGVPLWILGFLLLLPFLAGIAASARDTRGRASWLSPVIPAAGAILITVHVVNMAIEYTANNMSKSSPVHEPLHEVGGALFMIGMLPFGVALVATAVIGLAGRTLPRWLAGAAAVIGVTAVVNGTMLGSEAAWGFILATVWVLAAGVTLVVRRPRAAAAAEPTTAAATG